MMFRPVSFSLACIFHVMAGVQAQADTYALDPQHTEVRFSWDHLGLSRQGGRFTAAEGTVNFDPAQPNASTVEVKIPIKSIATGVKKLDEHLITTKDFFDAAAYPAITFKSTQVRMKSDKTGEVDGDLTINGISKPVVLDVVWNFTGEHPLQTINPVYAGAFASGFSATTQIRRSDWGVTRSIPYVSDELRITIETEMLRTAESPAAASAAGPVEAPAPPVEPALPEQPDDLPTLDPLPQIER
jgi:polyisoprenoid-binding protein YceI